MQAIVVAEEASPALRSPERVISGREVRGGSVAGLQRSRSALVGGQEAAKAPVRGWEISARTVAAGGKVPRPENGRFGSPGPWGAGSQLPAVTAPWRAAPPGIRWHRQYASGPWGSGWTARGQPDASRGEDGRWPCKASKNRTEREERIPCPEMREEGDDAPDEASYGAHDYRYWATAVPPVFLRNAEQCLMPC
jgi:hypothetical protein